MKPDIKSSPKALTYDLVKIPPRLVIEVCIAVGRPPARIFLNTKGKNPEEVSPELVDFLYYIENTTDEVAAKLDNPHIKYIHNRVCKVKASEKIGVKYMQAWEERYYAKQEAREEGLAEGRAEGFAEGDRLITQ